ncbi:MAG: efflux RND transporter periplasmic adaptor subunit [Candidatus Zixiibacteriota bacterium]
MRIHRFESVRSRRALAALMLLSLAAGCGGAKQQVADEARLPVLVATAARMDLLRWRDYTGTVEGIHQANVYSRISEVVVRIHAREGDRIKAGQPLITFDESGPGTALRQARAVFEDAQRTKEKYDRLFSEGAVSELERDAHRTAYDVATANYEAARDATVLTAPISGIVTEIDARVGRQAAMGERLALIAEVDTIRVLVAVSVYESRELSVGQRVLVRSEMDTTVTAGGWIDAISTSADADTRTISVEVLAANPDGRFLPGMFVRLGIELEKRSQVVAVPREALVYRESGLGLFVVRDSVAHFVAVTAGPESGGVVEIASGLQPGESVVTLGQNNIQEGSKVNPAPAESGSPAP